MYDFHKKSVINHSLRSRVVGEGRRSQVHAPSALIRERLFDVRKRLFEVRRSAHGLGAHGFSTERARLAGGTSIPTAQVHTALAQNVQGQPGALRFARGFKKRCLLPSRGYFTSHGLGAHGFSTERARLAGGTSLRSWFQKKASYLWGFHFFSFENTPDFES